MHQLQKPPLDSSVVPLELEGLDFSRAPKGPASIAFKALRFSVIRAADEGSPQALKRGAI